MMPLEGLKFVVFVNYGLEGWKPWAETADFDDAVEKWKEAMGNGSREVVIFERVPLKITDSRRES